MNQFDTCERPLPSLVGESGAPASPLGTPSSPGACHEKTMKHQLSCSHGQTSPHDQVERQATYTTGHRTHPDMAHSPRVEHIVCCRVRTAAKARKMLTRASITRRSAAGPRGGGRPGASSAPRKQPRCHSDWMMTFRKQLFCPLSLVSPLQFEGFDLRCRGLDGGTRGEKPGAC